MKYLSLMLVLMMVQAACGNNDSTPNDGTPPSNPSSPPEDPTTSTEGSETSDRATSMQRFFSGLEGFWRGRGETTEYDETNSPRTSSIVVELDCTQEATHRWGCGSHRFHDEMVADLAWVFEIRGSDLFDLAPDRTVRVPVLQATPSVLVYQSSWSASAENDARYVQTVTMELSGSAKLKQTEVVKIHDRIISRTEFELTKQ